MNDKLTLQWIVETLKKSGINSKQVVIDRLEKATYTELFQLQESATEEMLFTKNRFINNRKEKNK